jgi:hypothetical protein
MEARMSSIAARTYLTPQEYLAFERKATTKHEYVLVSQDRVCVEHYLREGAYWLRTEFRALEDIMPLSSIECKLRLRDIYNSVEMK